ncbi:MAG: GHMP kinase [Chloroflexi bacterium]|nr:MAG: GHMP kinase [Chloroflexota bacterium]
MMIRARAPLRISFCGGGTDLSPYVQEHGGVVLNATIDRYAYATLTFPSDRLIKVNSLDYKAVASFRFDDPLVYDGNFDLVKACLRRLLPDTEPDGTGIELYMETEAPPGSGLGASSALVVAVIGALRSWRRLPLDKYEVARVAWEVERKDVGIPGGLQDQYAAVFGGFNLIEFHDESHVVVNPLRIDPRIIYELQYNLLLVFTGTTRSSSRIIENQISGYESRQAGVLEAMTRMKALAIEAKDALLTGRLRDLAEILHEDFLAKKQTAIDVTTPRIEEMYEEARRLGVIGGKISGAGGGGFMFLYCPFDRKPAVTKRIVELGGQVLPMAFEHDGMQSWAAEDASPAMPAVAHGTRVGV